MPSLHAVLTLVAEPIEMGGVRANSNPQFQAVKFLAGADYNVGGRMAATPDLANPIRFAKPELPVG